MTITVAHDSGVQQPLASMQSVQGLFYALMADKPELSATIHDAAPRFENKSYKLFTFSGPRVKGEQTDAGLWELEFRSPVQELCATVSDAVQRRSWLRLGSTEVMITDMLLSQRVFFVDGMDIRMITPVTVHRTLEDGFTRYFGPSEPEFTQLIAENFARKYIACYGQPPEEGVLLQPRLVGPEDRIVTRFKGTVVKGCLGRFRLRGRPEYLSFLYDCGLGDRNSQGFGMFEGE